MREEAFESKSPSRTYPKTCSGLFKRVLFMLNANETRGTLWGLFSPKPRTRVIDPGPSSGTINIFLTASSR